MDNSKKSPNQYQVIKLTASDLSMLAFHLLKKNNVPQTKDTVET
jgi:hypothetical protein